MVLEDIQSDSGCDDRGGTSTPKTSRLFPGLSNGKIPQGSTATYSELYLLVGDEERTEVPTRLIFDEETPRINPIH